MKELELYQPIKDYFEALGFDVQAEVKDVDVVAVKGEELILVELKTSFSTKLLFQAIERQKISDDVYIAIPKPKQYKKTKEYKLIVRRLGLGLLYVTTKGVELVTDPDPYTFKRNNKKKKSLLKEMELRSLNINQGGMTGKRMTAYKEHAIRIALLLQDGELSTREIRKTLNIDKTTSIVYQNYYGWFESVSRGIYKLSNKGTDEIKEFQNLF